MALRVIGAGLGRTGTASIKLALEQLGVGRCYHMGEVLANPGHMEMWLDAAEGKPDWEKLLGEYGAAVDYPACTFWSELADYYPDAKVLLSVRDANSWFESTQETIFSPRLKEFASRASEGAFARQLEFLQRTVWHDFGDDIDNRAFMTSYFDQRIERIKSALPPERLLIYEVKQGWEPLCKFLQVPVSDGPFPRVNSRDETRRMIEALASGSSDPDGLAELARQRARDMFGDGSGGA